MYLFVLILNFFKKKNLFFSIQIWFLFDRVFLTTRIFHSSRALVIIYDFVGVTVQPCIYYAPRQISNSRETSDSVKHNS